MSITLDESQNRIVETVLYSQHNNVSAIENLLKNEPPSPIRNQKLKRLVNNHCIIEGGPGTGKSWIAEKLFKCLKEKREDILLLSFNKPLNMWFKQCLKEKENIRTLHSFFSKKYHRYSPKKIKDSLFLQTEYQKRLNRRRDYDTIIIDETQDFSLEMLRLLTTYAYRLICFIDPNQATESNKTSVDDLKSCLDCETTFTLENNYRNTQSIINLAKRFWNEEGFFPTKSMIGMGEKPVSLGTFDKIKQIIEENSNKTIGIAVLKEEVDRYERALSEFNPQVYKTGYDNNNYIDFSQEGVFIFQYRVIKGLEFDIVILVNPANIRNQKTIENQVYIAITRAKEKLYIYQEKNIKNDTVYKKLSDFIEE